jgi:hypothetical protein
MQVRSKKLTWLALAAPACLMAFTALAEVQPVGQSCATIKWNPEFLKLHPKAPVTCQEVTVRDGVKYAMFYGKVSKVTEQNVQVAITDVGNIPVSSIAFQVGAGGRITVGDKTEKVKDLRIGDKLTFWVREGEFGVSPTLTDAPIAILKPEPMPGT